MTKKTAGPQSPHRDASGRILNFGGFSALLPQSGLNSSSGCSDLSSIKSDVCHTAADPLGLTVNTAPSDVWGALLSSDPAVYPTVWFADPDYYSDGNNASENNEDGRGNVLIGRHRECNVRINDSTISNRHCLIYRTTKQDSIGQVTETVYIQDTSSNGTNINGVPIGRGRTKILKDGDILQLALLGCDNNTINSNDNGNNNNNGGGNAGNSAGNAGRFYFTFQHITLHRRSMLNNHFAGNNANVNANISGGSSSIFDDKVVVAEGSFNRDFFCTRVLGRGSFAEVRHAINRMTGREFAVKVIDRRRFPPKSRAAESIKRETSLIFGINHPFITRAYKAYEEPAFLYIVMEYIEDGELFNELVDYGAFTEDETRILFFQLFLAVKYLHDRRIAHRDLKPENVLLGKGSSSGSKSTSTANVMHLSTNFNQKQAPSATSAVNSPSILGNQQPVQTLSGFPNSIRPLHCKLSDFGLSRIVSNESMMQTLCGTPNYVAPEVLADGSSDRQYSLSVDMWSLGVILYVCLSGSPPFSEELAPPRMTDQIRLGRYSFPSPWWDHISDAAIDLIRGLLKVDPSERLTVREALAHPWMRTHYDGKIYKLMRPSHGNSETIASICIDDDPGFADFDVDDEAHHINDSEGTQTGYLSPSTRAVNIDELTPLVIRPRALFSDSKVDSTGILIVGRRVEHTDTKHTPPQPSSSSSSSALPAPAAASSSQQQQSNPQPSSQSITNSINSVQVESNPITAVPSTSITAVFGADESNSIPESSAPSEHVNTNSNSTPTEHQQVIDNAISEEHQMELDSDPNKGCDQDILPDVTDQSGEVASASSGSVLPSAPIEVSHNNSADMDFDNDSMVDDSRLELFLAPTQSQAPPQTSSVPQNSLHPGLPQQHQQQQQQQQQPLAHPQPNALGKDGSILSLSQPLSQVRLGVHPMSSPVSQDQMPAAKRFRPNN